LALLFEFEGNGNYYFSGKRFMSPIPDRQHEMGVMCIHCHL